MTKRTYLAVATLAASTLVFAGCGSAAHRSNSKTTGADALLASNGASTGNNGVASGVSTITTYGVGTVNGQPDTLTITVDVSTTAPHAGEALQQNNTLTTAVQKAFEHDGVAPTDLQTANLSVQQAYPTSQGYQVDDQVSATISDLARAGTTIDDALAAAGDAGRLESATLSMSNTNPLLGTARQEAVNAARVDAQELAAAAGERLGPLVSLTDETQQPTTTEPFQSNGAAAAGTSTTPVPIQPGTQQLSVDVTAVWAISS